MNRPLLVNFSAISSDDRISIRASLTKSSVELNSELKNEQSPIQSIRLFSKELFRIKIIGFSAGQDILYSKEFDSDNYGKFELKIPRYHNQQQITHLNIYETRHIKGVEFHLGSFIPMAISHPKKIIISDFDKTLVDTRYSTPKEMYYSLNKPLSYFPSVEKSITLLKSYINQEFQPFILSASPHFYENAIRNWLYQNEIYASNIFLKDYRHFISLFDGLLTTKDIKKQGFYKLNQLVDILLMCGFANEIILMGDGFESDPVIYLTLKRLCHPHSDPWKVWQSLKYQNIFNLTSKQDSHFITKFYQLNELAKKNNLADIKIYIRSTKDNIQSLKEKTFPSVETTELNKTVEYYLA